MIGDRRRRIRERVVALVTAAKREHWGAAHFLIALRAEMPEPNPRTYERRVWCDELRRAHAALRSPPDFRQLDLFEARGAW